MRGGVVAQWQLALLTESPYICGSILITEAVALTKNIVAAPQAAAAAAAGGAGAALALHGPLAAAAGPGAPPDVALYKTAGPKYYIVDRRKAPPVNAGAAAVAVAAAVAAAAVPGAVGVPAGGIAAAVAEGHYIVSA